MAMEKSHEKIKKDHNTKPMKDRIKELAVRYAQADEQSMELNAERSDIREEIKNMGLDTKAWQDEIGRAKRDLRKKDGYDESVSVIRDALGEMKMEDLFEHVLRRDREFEEEREAKALKRAEDKATKKEQKPTGVAQAEAVQKALN